VTRATWDDDGTKYFETGIDRGMLYIPFIPGMVWNGLVKVTETPTGTAPREFYIDGQKYLNLPSLEEYAATIEAFSAPKEFAAATGMAELSPGMYVTDQTRQAFGFSYRTLIGSDGSDLGADYKIHIVYNAMAKTSDFTAKTTSGSADSPTQSWSLTTIAPQDSTPSGLPRTSSSILARSIKTSSRISKTFSTGQTLRIHVSRQYLSCWRSCLKLSRLWR